VAVCLSVCLSVVPATALPASEGVLSSFRLFVCLSPHTRAYYTASVPSLPAYAGLAAAPAPAPAAAGVCVCVGVVVVRGIGESSSVSACLSVCLSGRE